MDKKYLITLILSGEIIFFVYETEWFLFFFQGECFFFFLKKNKNIELKINWRDKRVCVRHGAVVHVSLLWSECILQKHIL